MKLARLSVGTLMGVVALVAMNLTVCRVLFSYHPDLFAGLLVPLIVIQVGVYRIVRRGGRVRVFWAGFVVFGLGAMVSLYWAMAYPEGIGRCVEPATGRVVEQVTAGSAMWVLWSRYGDFVVSCLDWLADALRIHLLDASGFVDLVVFALVLPVPQLVIALVGGLLARLVVRMVGTRGLA